MNLKRFSRIRVLLFLALLGAPGALCRAETPSTEAEIWQTAVAMRAQSITLAPGELAYEQYHLERKKNEPRNETGRFRLSYGEDGKAAVSVMWAKRGEKDFTAERAARLEKQASGRNELLVYFTPFDPDLQDRLDRKSGTRVFSDGRSLWQFEFHLPAGRNRGFAGTARVGDNGRPIDFRFTLSPMPWFFDFADVYITFDAGNEYLVFDSISFKYKASFLFWVWNGGGSGVFADWKRISAPPKLN
jgi:hypothetical protein